MKDKNPQKIIILTLITILIIFYIRIITYNKPIVFSDETKYLEILNLTQQGISHPISGTGYVHTILTLNKLTSINLETLTILYSALISLLSITLIYLIYKNQLKKSALTASFLLLTTSYFIFPLIEARPQQLGMLLTLISTFSYGMYLKNKKNYLIPFSFFYSFTFYYHILSFALTTAIITLLFLWELTDKKTNYKKTIVPLTILLTTSLIYLSPNSPYSRNRQDLIDTSMTLWSKLNQSLIPALTLTTLIIIITTLLLIKYISSFKNNKKHTPTTLTIILFTTPIIALGTQFYIRKDLYLEFYNHSLFLFLSFQLGNIIFGTLYLLSIKKTLDNKEKQDFFFKTSITLLIIGTLTIITSLFLDYRLNNLLIRVLNYWTIFAAPTAAKKLNPKKHTNKIIITLLIILSVINASRKIPTI